MNDLYIDFEKGLNLGEKIKDKSFKLNQLLKELEDIQGTIEDDDIKNLNDDLNVIVKLSEIVGETGDFLINVSNAYNKVDNICSQREE